MLMGRETAGDWFILRTAGRSTLPLASSLAEDGFEVWTPVRTMRVRVPRKNVRREVRLPMLPSYVFVRARHLNDLLDLSHMEERPRRCGGRKPAHRSFSIFRFLDQIQMVADASLDQLRLEERRAIPRTLGPKFVRDQIVRVGSGPFEGLRGRVERHESGYVLVIFEDGKRRVKIPTFLLHEDNALIRPASVAKAA
jgi:transcription antitermination factor NusG